MAKRRTFGAWLKSRRRELGLSIRGLAELTGIPRSVLSRLEEGSQEPVIRPGDWRALGEALRVDARDLASFAGFGDPSSKLGEKALAFLRSELFQAFDAAAGDEGRSRTEPAEPSAEPAKGVWEVPDPRFMKALQMLAEVFALSEERDPVAWRGVEEFLEFQISRIRESGKHR